MQLLVVQHFFKTIKKYWSSLQNHQKEESEDSLKGGSSYIVGSILSDLCTVVRSQGTQEGHINAKKPKLTEKQCCGTS